MKPKIVSVLIGIVLLVGLSWLFIFRDYLAAQRMTQYRPTQEYQTKQHNSISYDAEKEIGAATAKMQLTKSLTTVLTGVAGKEKRIALTFDGRGSQLVMDKILESLQKHQVQATFFIEGMQVAEDPQLIAAKPPGQHRLALTCKDVTGFGIGPATEVDPARDGNGGVKSGHNRTPRNLRAKAW